MNLGRRSLLVGMAAAAVVPRIVPASAMPGTIEVLELSMDGGYTWARVAESGGYDLSGHLVRFGSPSGHFGSPQLVSTDLRTGFRRIAYVSRNGLFRRLTKAVEAMVELGLGERQAREAELSEHLPASWQALKAYGARGRGGRMEPPVPDAPWLPTTAVHLLPCPPGATECHRASQFGPAAGDAARQFPSSA